MARPQPISDMALWEGPESWRVWRLGGAEGKGSGLLQGGGAAKLEDREAGGDKKGVMLEGLNLLLGEGWRLVGAGLHAGQGAAVDGPWEGLGWWQGQRQRGLRSSGREEDEGQALGGIRAVVSARRGSGAHGHICPPMGCEKGSGSQDHLLTG